MNPLCYQLLKGTLNWTGGTQESFQTTLDNTFPFIIYVTYIPNLGQLPPQSDASPYAIGAGGNLILSHGGGTPSGYYKATVAATGALVTVFACSGTTSLVLDRTSLNPPNDIGPIPVPTMELPIPIEPQPSPVVEGSTMVIPPDSPRVLVAFGTTVDGNIITREQYWARQNDSLCLAGHETRTVSYTVTSGKQQTSSDMKTLETSLGLSAGGGWGPVSASLSASLSRTSTSFQQVTVTEQTTAYLSNTIHNPDIEPVAYFRWQLMDVITVLGNASTSTATPLSSLIQAQNPTIVMGPYWVSPRPIPPNIEMVRGLGLFEYK